ncbi:putative family protein [Diplodia seriata]|uniref:Putative family protein n=1 Tax=Diplodia seriata TaxID=420778 RepID=A0A0G2DVP8_9PEZI|nr:putative family protein [Diplodia seriata]
MPPLAAEFSAGALFGTALATSGIYSPATIKAQMHLSDFTMLQTFLGASASGALAVHLADRLGFAPIKPRAPQSLGCFAYDGNVVGGALLGCGMAVTGACPGTALVQMAAGLRGGAYVVLGGLVGGLVHGVVAVPLLLLRRRSTSTHSTTPCKQEQQPATTLQDSLRLGTNALLLAWEVLCVLAIAAAEAFRRRTATAPYSPSLPAGPGLVGPVAGGCLIGLAQAATVLLTRHSIGVSAAYGSLAQAVSGKGALVTPSIFPTEMTSWIARRELILAKLRLQMGFQDGQVLQERIRN